MLQNRGVGVPVDDGVVNGPHGYGAGSHHDERDAHQGRRLQVEAGAPILLQEALESRVLLSRRTLPQFNSLEGKPHRRQDRLTQLLARTGPPEGEPKGVEGVECALPGSAKAVRVRNAVELPHDLLDVHTLVRGHEALGEEPLLQGRQHELLGTLEAMRQLRSVRSHESLPLLDKFGTRPCRKTRSLPNSHSLGSDACILRLT